MKKVLALFGASVLTLVGWAGEVAITGVTAQQRYPWNGLVDITVTLSGEQKAVSQTVYSFAATNIATWAAVPIASVSQNGSDSGSNTTWTRRFVWNATNDVGEVKIADIVLAVSASLGGVQLWENGPYWKECNVGATKPEEYGYYFWWGDTVGYVRNANNDGWVSVKDGTSFSFDNSHCPTYGTGNAALQSAGYIDSTGNLVAAHDAATTHLGTPWRMPTHAEFSALVNNCDTSWTTQGGVYGRFVKGRGAYASKSIFLPATGFGGGSNLAESGRSGYTWSSMPSSGNTLGAWSLSFGSNGISEGSDFGRNFGRSVRPVRGFAKVSGALTHLALDARSSTRTASATETIRFSPAWETNADGAVATVCVNGVVVTNASEAGVFEWKPTQDGEYQLTHVVTTNGIPAGELLNATFEVDGCNPVITPASGTTFDTSLTVTMSCAAEGATIHFTTNGTTPTLESPVYKRFKIYGRTTVKAIAFFADGSASGMTTAEYAKGTMATPVITPTDGTVFQHSNQEVSIAREGTDGVLRYTLDGSEPTAESPVYRGPFTISETTTVKAKVFGEDYFDSATAMAVLTREWLTVATPVITVPSSFSGTKTTATIACATEGAVIRYTMDGSEPNAQSLVYAGAFDVTASCTIKAKAFKVDFVDSAAATAVVTKNWCVGDAMNDPDRTFTTDAQNGWVRDTAVSKDGVESMRSGAIGCSASYGTYVASTMSTTVNGKGTVRFWWKASCENDPDWDHGEFSADGETWLIYGETDWEEVSYTFTTDGDHVITWKYLKDDAESEGDDCIWVDQFHWTPETTTTTSVPVPGVWIDKYYPGTLDYEAAAKRQAANGLNTVEEAYVAGLDPTNAASVFTASIALSNGMVYVSWTPNLNTGDVTRIYKLVGREKLDEGDWEPVQSWHRFFTVTVAMPTGAAGEMSDVSGEGFVPEEKPLGGVQLWEDGPYWAECNVGATRPEEYGYYFWWGDTVGYKRNENDDGWVSVKDGTSFSFDSSHCPTYGVDTSELQLLGWINDSGNLTAQSDAATVHLGAPWRMPTDAEVSALINNCTTAWITTNGVFGRLVTGKGAYASKSIFLPAAGNGSVLSIDFAGSIGFYWSSTQNLGDSHDGWNYYFGWNYFDRDGNDRYYGQSIRPLRGFAK